VIVNKTLMIVIFGTLVSGCSTKSMKFKVMASEDMTLESASASNISEKKEIRKGELIELSGQIDTFSSKGKVPMMLIGPERVAQMDRDAEGHEWEIRLKNIEDWRPEQTDEFINKNVDQLFYNLIDILVLTKTKKSKEALAIVTSMLEKYPKLSALHFVRAQVEMMEQRRDEALKSIDTCISLNPNYAEAKKLREKILQRETR